MKTAFAQNLTVVTFAHVGVIVCFVIVAAMPVYRKKMPDFMAVALLDPASSRNEDPPMPVSLREDPPVPPEPATVEQPPVPPEPQVTRTEPTSMPDPQPVPAPVVRHVTTKPAPEKQKQVKIKPVSASAKSQKSSAKPARRVTTTDIAKALGSGISSKSSRSQGLGRSSGPVSADEEAVYRGLIYQAFHDAWLQPSYADAGGAVVTVSVQLLGDGVVARPVLVKSSGNEVMDASVMQAVRSVGRVSGLSADFVRRHSEIEFRFKVEREGARP